MDRSARRVKAQRDRQRLPYRGTAARWTRRIAGLLGTAAFLGVGVVSAQMIIPDPDQESAVLGAAPAATPAKKKPHKKKEKPKPRKPAGPTKAQKAAREDAVAYVRAQGYTTLRPTDYDPKATLRVLIARPVGDAAGGYRAYFFLEDRFLANDAPTPSTVLKVAKRGKRTVTLSYGVYTIGDTPGAPSDRKRIRFRLEDEALHALDLVPLADARFQRQR
jgi:hypothetical protein